MKIKTKLLPIGTPTVNGRIYTRETVEKMIHECSNRLNDRQLLGTFYNAREIVTLPYNVNLSKVTHVTEDLYIENDELWATVETLDNLLGRDAEVLWKMGKLEFTLCTVGKINEDRTVDIDKLLYIAAILKNENMV